jgi:hypothetical protein
MNVMDEVVMNVHWRRAAFLAEWRSAGAFRQSPK